MTWEEELEGIIKAIVVRQNAAELNSAEWRFCERQLRGLHGTYELAGPIIEELTW